MLMNSAASLSKKSIRGLLQYVMGPVKSRKTKERGEVYCMFIIYLFVSVSELEAVKAELKSLKYVNVIYLRSLLPSTVAS